MIKDGLWHDVILLLTLVSLHVFLRRAIKPWIAFPSFLEQQADCECCDSHLSSHPQKQETALGERL